MAFLYGIYISLQTFMEAVTRGNIKEINIVNANKKFDYDICIPGKMCQQPFPRASEKKLVPNWFTDLSDPMHVM